MSLAGLLALAFFLALAGLHLGLVVLVRFLTGETEAERAMRFDPFAAPPPSPWFFGFFAAWRRSPKRLTYHRDSLGRYRRHRR